MVKESLIMDLQNPAPPVLLESLASRLSGATIVGNGKIAVCDLYHPAMMLSPDGMVLILEASAVQRIQNTPARCKTAVVSQVLMDEKAIPEGLFEGLLVVGRPRLALATLLAIFEKKVQYQPGIHPMAVIEATATVHPSASIGAFTYVGNKAEIGENTVLLSQVTVGAGAVIGQNGLLYPGARIGERVRVGNHVIIHYNASIGADGFSYVTPEPGSVESAKASGGKVTQTNSKIYKINSIGTVVIEDDVEIGACTTIDRSNLGATLIKKGTKIDNLVMIGHNNEIGENCMIVSQVGVAGSCQIGNRVVIAGQAGLADHLKVGDDAIIMAQSGVMRNIDPREIVLGSPAMPRREAMQNILYTSKMKAMAKELKELKARLTALEKQQAPTPSKQPSSTVEV
jgi:UDP-3-O-[3-hydroxymyristoyl] glucosamine N-acyltransferase